MVTRPCILPRIEGDTLADLETAYLLRGAALANCEAARSLSVEIIEAERRLIDQWLASHNPPPRWQFWKR